MILMTGGAFQGALECAKNMIETTDASVVIDGRESGIEQAETCRIWDHMTDWFKRQMSEGKTPEEIWVMMDGLLEKNPGIILITTELGCGLVPIDRFDRAYREAHGRLCCHLAEKAERVYRVTCGLAQCIKGDRETC